MSDTLPTTGAVPCTDPLTLGDCPYFPGGYHLNVRGKPLYLGACACDRYCSGSGYVTCPSLVLQTKLAKVITIIMGFGGVKTGGSGYHFP